MDTIQLQMCTRDVSRLLVLVLVLVLAESVLAKVVFNCAVVGFTLLPSPNRPPIPTRPTPSNQPVSMFVVRPVPLLLPGGTIENICCR
ncbi:hypothetical protein B0H65DRAFT_63523 [Neurospora tetraspora]|uniref:Uncharacterized protein n=1 Tax=Neurospora tetraspora TaxID=94610 RepID=A0AAE0JS13_9PEZI|nr:hypothetical protein B0H65DRAFT_63523 [Neurospora tetraspora]